jgi:T-complex protein 1 subunit beta
MVSFSGALATVDLIKSTLGPKSMDKILESKEPGADISITNDGSTILKSIHLDNPAAKILVDISKIQDDEVGDGTTSVVILGGELLKEAEKLIDHKVHPMTIIAGFQEASNIARNRLESISFTHCGDPKAFRKALINIARTALCSKIIASEKDHFSNLAVDAVLRLRGSDDLDMVNIISKEGGTLKDSFLDEGFIIDKNLGFHQTRRLENASILVANTPMDTDRIKIYGTKVKTDSLGGISDIETAEKLKMKAKCEKIISHGINCFINRQLIYDYPEFILSQNGVLTIEHVDFDGVERLAKVLGCDIVSTFDNSGKVKYGYCRKIEEVIIGGDRCIHFSGVTVGEACTIVLRGASSHILAEAVRSLHDTLCVLISAIKDPRIVYGGGFSELQMAIAVDNAAIGIPGKKALAMQSFARALCKIPYLLCENAGIDSTEIISTIRLAHMTSGLKYQSGIDVIRGKVGNMEQLGVFEAFKVKLQILLSATEATECILRVDEVICNTPRERTK